MKRLKKMKQQEMLSAVEQFIPPSLQKKLLKKRKKEEAYGRKSLMSHSLSLSLSL